MRACLVFLCLLAATFALSSKPHGKHHGLHKSSHKAEEKAFVTEEANEPQILPTLVTFEASSLEQEDEELSSQDNANINKEGEFEETDGSDKSTAVLLSEEELVDLLKKEAEEEEEGEERVLEEEKEAKERKLDDKLEIEVINEEEEVKDESVEDTEMLEKDEDEGGNVSLKEKEDKSVVKIADGEEQGSFLEETDGSTEVEIPVDLDYAADSGILQPLQIVSAKIKTETDVKERENHEQGPASIAEDFEHDTEHMEAVDSEEVSDQDTDKDSSPGFELGSELSAKEEEKSKNDSASYTKGKTRKQKKNKRARKHSPQTEETESVTEQSQQVPQVSEGSSIDNKAQKAKRRRAGKWGPLVGMNPVQIRATVDLYPGSRPSLGGGVIAVHVFSLLDPCDNFPCKRGKTCKLDAENKPSCVCEEPSECPPSVNEFDHVCGTNNKTYNSSCELFATKCNLEGTKRGHRLHLDYTGPCKLIPLCVDTELVQFPLRMRDWLKNVLLQLYEHDSMSPGFLTPKQRFRVKKIFESERRLHAGDYSVELLAQDFEKNYNMYIYPVHWQFAQLDQHPSDRVLSHSELAPLRVPLVPMEHCTSRFFQECDADKDKQVSFKEWTSCFGINNDDMDANLLF
uniref:Kazal-like domain-containing protein n=1 Tax=Cyclopterus lumpus TaxID=8103 RepID=A0A8C2WX87_CYCLU